MNIVTGARRFPMSMALHFDAAFRRLGHTVFKVGPYSGDGGAIPWPGNPSFPQYVDKPDIELPVELSSFPIAALKSRLPEHIDAVFSFDAGFRFTGRLEGVPTVLYMTDPHAIDYRSYYGEYDFAFSAQNLLMGHPNPPGVIWVPLAYDPDVHKKEQPIDAEHRPVDVCFVGVMGGGDTPDNAYRARWRGVHLLKEHYQVFATTGAIFRENREYYNRAKIAFNHSSQWDLPMRNWEGPAMGCCLVTNKLPYLSDLGFVDGETCLIFESESELIEKVTAALASGDWQRIAQNGHKKLAGETYDARCQQMIRVMFGEKT